MQLTRIRRYSNLFRSMNRPDPNHIPVNCDTQTVRAFLQSKAVPFEMRHFESTTHSARDSAAQLGIPLNQIVKTLCFVTDDKPILALCPGSNRVSMKKLKAITGCKKLPTARPEQIEEWTGFAVGGVNPFFENDSIPIYCDPSVMEHKFIWFGAGSPNTLVSLPSASLASLLRLVTADIRE